MNTPYYDDTVVKAHGSISSRVYLINEAPGPRESSSGIPAYGEQGGNIYRSLWRNDVSWSIEFNNGKYFHWPKYSDHDYFCKRARRNIYLRKAFLEIRSRYLTCSNAYDRWPKPSRQSRKWVPPQVSLLASQDNLQRIKNEVTENHELLLVCGVCAWTVLFGEKLKNANDKIGQRLSDGDLLIVNDRFCANFKFAFYMGHTSLWGKSKYAPMIDFVIRSMKKFFEGTS